MKALGTNSAEGFRRAVLAALLAALCGGLTPYALGDVLDDWAEVYLRALKAENTAPPLGARGTAIFALAVADAVNAVERRWEPALFTASVTGPVDLEAAIAAAAHDTGVALFPSRRADFDSLWSQNHAGLASSAAREAGFRLGSASAAAWLAGRAADGSATQVPYIPTNAPGAWRRTPPYFRPPDLPHWSLMRPFGLTNAAQFRPPGPPKLGSERWASDFILTRSLGGKTSAKRSPDQTEAALFWSDFTGTITPPGHWTRITLALANREGLAVGDKVRLLALVQMALADTGIACWDAKFAFNFWRPVTAVRCPDDGNPATETDLTWEPLLSTPPFPEYVSGHSAFSGAAGEVLRRWFKRDDVGFSITSDTVPGSTRHFNSISAAVEEIGLSRIWGGIHFRSADEDGQRLGRQIGDWTFDRFLKPLPAREVVKGEK